MSQPTQAAAAPFNTVQLIPPDKFDFKNADEWPKWIRRFERFRVASSLDKQTQEFQVNTLMYILGDEAEDILNALPLNEDQKKSYEDVKQAFGKHCASKRNVIFERTRFNRRNPEPGESGFGANQTNPAPSAAPSPFVFSSAPTSGFGANQTPSFGTPFGSPSNAAPSPAPAFGAKPNAAPVFGQQTNSTPVFGAVANSAPGGGFQFGGASGFGPSNNNISQPATFNIGSTKSFTASPAGQQTIARRKIKTAVQCRK